MELTSWNYSKAIFDSDQYNEYMLKYSPWSGHRLFGYDLLSNLNPDTVVELGSFYGCSIFALAQAVKDNNLKTILWAVDLWQVFDKFTEHDYEEDIYHSFLEVRNTCFSEEYVKMLKMSFDDAVNKFEDKSIDILHIDGSHYYEDVKHDFEIWKCKLKDNGIVLFHDIADEVINGGIMGSHIYWQELKKEYPWTVEFDFSCGLGVLFLSQNNYNQFISLVDIEYYQKMNNSSDVMMKDSIRKMFFKLRDQNLYITDLKKQLDIKESHLIKYSETVAGKDSYIEKLSNKINVLNSSIESSDQNTRIRNDYIKKLEKEILEIKESLQIKENEVKKQSKVLREKEDILYKQKKVSEEKENEVKKLIYRIEELEKQIKNDSTMIKNLEIENTKLNISYKKTLEYKIKRILRK